MKHSILILIASLPIIWGDGIHDDTAGFEAMLCKQLFKYRPGALIETKRSDGISDFELNGTYLLRKGIPFTKNGLYISQIGQVILSNRIEGILYELDCAESLDGIS